jgi:hypothetical protein
MLASFVWYARQVRQQYLDHALIEAIKKNDTPAAVALLDQGAYANAKDKPETPVTLKSLLVDFWQRLQDQKSPRKREYHASALTLLLGYENNELAPYFPQMPENPYLLKALLAHGANTETKNAYGYTLLFQAVLFHYHASVRLLLEYGANPDLATETGTNSLPLGTTPLMIADEESAILLLAHKAKVNVQNGDGQTALMLAANRARSARSVQRLLAYGAEAHLKDRWGQDALLYAVGSGDEASVQTIEQAVPRPEKERLPAFAQYPVQAIYNGKSVPLQKAFRNFVSKTGVVEAAREKANFAGHYILDIGGCGGGCRSIYVIDANTGHVYYFGPSLVTTMEDYDKGEIQYRLDSRLLVLRGMRDEKEADYGAHFYKFEAGKFVLLRSVRYRRNPVL